MPRCSWPGSIVAYLFAPDDPAIVATMRAIEDQLWVKTSVGGVARYFDDYYHQVRHDVMLGTSAGEQDHWCMLVNTNCDRPIGP